MSTINTSDAYVIQGSTLQNICDVIKDKKGLPDLHCNKIVDRVEDLADLDYDEIKDVMFIDYNGDVLYSYDKADFLALTQLPAAPSHEGLVFQEWNWSLSDAKDEVLNKSGACCIGANYTTTDGYTHFYADIETGMTVRIVVDQVSSNNVTIDWGDDTQSSTTSTSTTLTHLYVDTDSYDIIYKNEGDAYLASTMFQVGDSTYLGNYDYVLKRVAIGNKIIFQYNKNYSFAWHYNLKSVSLPTTCVPSGGNIGLSQFSWNNSLCGLVFPNGVRTSGGTIYCPLLRAVSLPCVSNVDTYSVGNFFCCGLNFLYMPTPAKDSLDKITVGSSNLSLNYNILLKRIEAFCDYFVVTGFQYCTSLRGNSINLVLNGRSDGTITASMFYNCHSILGDLEIGANVTSIPQTLLSSCTTVTKVICLGDITSVGATSLNNMYSCTEYDFTNCTSVPTLVNANAFNFTAGTPNANAKIVVPDNLVSTWKAASNWSTHSAHIFGESEI